MKKIFTLAAAILASLSLTWAAGSTTLFEWQKSGATKIETDNTNLNASDYGSMTIGTSVVGRLIGTNIIDNNKSGYKLGNNDVCIEIQGTEDFAAGDTVIIIGVCGGSGARAFAVAPETTTNAAADTVLTNTQANTSDALVYSVVLKEKQAGAKLRIFRLAGKTMYLQSIKVVRAETCTDPELTVSPTKGTGFVGDPIDITISSKNQSKPINPVVTVDGVPGVYGTNYTFSVSTGLVQATPLKAGKFEITFSQASNDTYCAAEETVTFVISEKTPVTEVTVDGPDAAYVGEAVTFTATAANASDYAWTVNGVDANTNAAEFTYTPAAAGEYSIVCSARNKFNAAEDWIASEAKVLTASNVSGELVSYTVNSDANGAANLTGALAAKATAKVSLTKGSSQALDEYTGYKMDRGKYVGVTLTSGKFAEGDTVSFMVTKASGTAKLYLYDDEQGTNRLDSIDFSGQTGWATFVLNQATAGVYLYRSNPDVKPYDQNPYVAALKVIRPKAVVNVDVTLVGVTIDGVALPSDFVTDLINNRTFTIQTSYVNAPVVAFVKRTETYYEGETEPVSTNDSIKVTATEFEGKWLAQANIGENTYTITLAKAASFTVHYMDGTTELGTENVAANGTPANYLLYQSKSLAAFVGWYIDVDLTTEANMNAPITADTYFYAKFENKYAESVNIEKLILDNSKGYDIKTNVLNGTHGYASNYTASSMDITNDSLNDDKGAMRNYAYLGLKIKSKSLLNCRVAKGQTILIKFGELKTTPQVSVNGSEYAPMPITNGVCTYTASGDDLLSMYVSEDGKAVVLKQIMIGENPALENVVYDIACAEVQNGTLTCDWAIALPGETVKLTVTPAEGYKIGNVTLNSETVEAVENVYSFIMPEKVANVAATFVKDIPSALGNTEAEGKAVKVVRDGQLLILKNGVLYNAQGAIVK